MTSLSHDDVINLAAAGTLLDTILSREWQLLGKGDPLFLSEVVGAHNRGEIDALSLFTDDALSHVERHAFYGVQTLFSTLIPELVTTADKLLLRIEAVLRAGGSAAMFPGEALSAWCRKNPSRVVELLELVGGDIPNPGECLFIALTSGTEAQREYLLDNAYDYLRNGSETQRRGAASALSQLPLDSDKNWQRLIETFGSLNETGSDESRSTILRAMFQRLKNAPAPQLYALHELIGAAASFPDELVLHECAYGLAFCIENIPLPLAELLLDALADVTTEQAQVTTLLDIALMRFVQAGWSYQARCFVEVAFAKREPSPGIARFESLRRKLLEVGGDPLEDWVIAWLLSGDATLCNALRDDFLDIEFDDYWFSIDFTRMPVEDHEYGYLARKVISVFFSRPKVMTSILVSLLRYASPTARAELERLVFEPVLVNYSGTVRGYLEPIASDPNDLAQASAHKAILAIDEYLAGLQSAGIIKELYPSERERQMEWQRRSDEMNVTMQEARKHSFLASFGSESVLLYGSSSVTWVEDLHQGPPRRLETSLANVGHSIEIPRGEVVDPLGLSHTIYLFRTEKRPQ